MATLEERQQLALRRHQGSSSADRLNSYGAPESPPLPAPPPPPLPMIPFAHGGRRYRVDTKPSLVV